MLLMHIFELNTVMRKFQDLKATQGSWSSCSRMMAIKTSDNHFKKNVRTVKNANAVFDKFACFFSIEEIWLA